MITFEEARQRVLDAVTPVTQTENLAVEHCLGRILSHPIDAPFNVPNADNSAMDGFGVRWVDLDPHHTVELKVVADLPAGDRITTPLKPMEAIRIMTGAPIPPGCDCVVMQEVVQRNGDLVRIPPGEKKGQNIRLAGEDIREGTAILNAGTRLKPADLGLLTSLGFTHVQVFRRVKVALVSTGNEVAEAGQPLKPGHVYDSNRSCLRAALQALGLEVLDLGLVRDEMANIQDALTRGGRDADAIISTGGVSVGDFDLVKQVLQEMGQIHFWKVAMKPGKPQAYGKLGRADFFGLPGNPVSCLVVFLLIVKPALMKMMGTHPQQSRYLNMPFRGHYKKKAGRINFLRGIVHFDGKDSWVETTGSQGSGILTSMAKADAFIIVPEEQLQLQDGDQAKVLLIDYCA